MVKFSSILFVLGLVATIANAENVHDDAQARTLTANNNRNIRNNRNNRRPAPPGGCFCRNPPSCTIANAIAVASALFIHPVQRNDDNKLVLHAHGMRAGSYSSVPRRREFTNTPVYHLIILLFRRWFSRVTAIAQSLPRRTTSQTEMEQLGAAVADHAMVGDVFFLKGNLGCGKTCFARGFIRRLAKDDALQVTSPTYLLVNTYESADRVALFHVDLYRLDSVAQQDTKMLGLDDAFTRGITLIEWPERLQDDSKPKDRLEVCIAYDRKNREARCIHFEPIGPRWLK